MSELLKGIEPCFVPVVTVRFCHGTNELPSGSASAESIARVIYSRPPSSVATHPHSVRMSCLRTSKPLRFEKFLLSRNQINAVSLACKHAAVLDF